MNQQLQEKKTSYTSVLSDYIKNFKYEDIPEEVVERAKMIILQTIGVSLAVNKTAYADKALYLATKANGGEEGTVAGWGYGTKLSLDNACFLNGTLSDALDWEDTSWTGHPAAGIIPCSWCTAEAFGKSGKDVIAAVVLGYEVYQRIACAIQPTLEMQKNKGWGLTSWQIFGCIAPAAKIFDLDTTQINQALSLGTSWSTLPTCLHEFTMSDFYHFEHGFKARDGILITRMAEQGIKGCMDALDQKEFYAELISDVEDEAWYTRNLGSQWLTMTTLLKHWPANFWVQTPTELVKDIVEQNEIPLEDIKEIIIDPPRMSRMDQPPEGGFKSLTHAQFSIPYVVSVMLHNKEPGAYWYSAEMLSNPEIIEFAHKVVPGKSDPDPRGLGFKLFREGSFLKKHITVNTYDGKSYDGYMDCPPGHPANMLTRDEFCDRFRIQAKPVLDTQRTEEFLEALCNLEECPDVRTLAQYLS